jgi:hypothetical protein
MSVRQRTDPAAPSDHAARIAGRDPKVQARRCPGRRPADRVDPARAARVNPTDRNRPWKESSMNSKCRGTSYCRLTRLAGPALIGAVMVLATGCASTPPPTADLALSDAAVAHAAAAGGVEAAPADMRSAREKLDRANLAMANKDYDHAQMLAQEAQVDALLAERKAESAQARKAASAVQEDTRVLREEIERKRN